MTAPTSRQQAAHPLQRIDGVPESTLGDATAARLPDRSAAAPWETRVDAVVWAHPATRHARELAGVRAGGGRVVPVTVAAFVRYLESPVGPYHEVLAAPALLARAPLPAATVPFIAVDSLASIHGGRANWALPKTMAAFAWASGDEAAPTTIRADGVDAEPPWSVTARVAPRRRRFPLALALRDVQLAPDGRELDIPVRVAGRAQLARVTVAASGPSLPSWLRHGRHWGVVVRGARMHVGAPR